MPFKSQAQRRYMHANHPDIAEKFESHTEKGARLPERVGKKKSSKHCDDRKRRGSRSRSRSR